ncbi:polysaccharide deacetylase family protein [Haloterrigena salifodinae]|uniref:polysaccharide deacetylase family protein n=1 Tax=Haloterrigena salifodinae TaxID=2675099 RepID=UPI000F86A7ED|nr:hypothetical protein [Haloterrigena salifodinae]
MTHRNRRTFLTTIGTAGAIGLAGCLSSLRDDDDDDESAPSQEENGGGAETDGLDLPGEPIDDFEALDDWSAMIDAGDLEATADDPYADSQSAQLTADEGTETASIYRSVPDGLDLRDRNLSLAVSFSERDQLRLSLELFAPDARSAIRMHRTLTGPTDRWVRVDFGTIGVDGTPDLSDVREIRLTARRRGDQTGPIDCRIDDLRTVDRPDRGAVMLLFDATLEDHYKRALKHLDAFEFAGVEAVIPEALGESGRLSMGQLETLGNAGWEAIARPRTGARFLHEFPREQQAERIQRTKRFLESRGFADGARHFMTPRNILGSETLDLVREHHETAFRFGSAPNGLPLTDFHDVGFFSGTAGQTTRDYVDYAAEYGQLAVLHFEHIGDDGISESAFADLLTHVDAADVDVVTPSDLLEGY